MTNNTLEKIKEAEKLANEIIEGAKQKAESIVAETEKNSQKTFDQVENALSKEIEEMLNDAKKDIQSIKVKKARELSQELGSLGNIDKKKTDKATSLIISQIKDGLS